jgi:molybdate transport system permease protein
MKIFSPASISGPPSPTGQPHHPVRGRAHRLGNWVDQSWRLAALPLLFLFILPIIVLLTRASPQQLWANLQEEQIRQAIFISFKTTLVSLAVIVATGTPLAFLMGRYQFRFKRVLDTFIDLPTILPPAVAGLALLMTFGRRSLLGGWLEERGLQIAFTQAAVIIAQVFIAAPFFVRAAAIGFAGVDQEIIQAAQLDGGGRWQIFRFIIMPLSRLALFTGAMTSWARALGEFGATIIFAGNFPGRTQTMPTAIYLGFEVDLDMAITLSVILVLTSFVSLLLVKWLVAGEREEEPDSTVIAKERSD